MENKSFIKFLVLTILFLFSNLVFAQTDESSSFVYENEKGDLFISQKLFWEKDEAVSSFVFELEKRNDRGEYKQIVLENTTDNFIELNLEPGVYRYRIGTYNFLNKLENTNYWEHFEIKKAIEPKITGVTPKQIFLDEQNDGIYTVNGRNFSKDSIIEFSYEDGKMDGTVTDFSENGEQFKFIVDMNQLNPGNYKFKITNEGGLYTEEENITVKFKKLMDFDLFAGYVFPIVVLDDTIQTYFEKFTFPISAMAGFSFIPVKKAFGYFGAGILASYSRLDIQKENYKLGGNLLSAHLNFVYQKPIIRGRLTVDVHAGAGIGMFQGFSFHFNNGIDTEPLNAMGISVDGGLGLQFYITKRLYTEVRGNVSCGFFKDIILFSVNPAAFIGWQF